jgi:hypothetical protein
MFHPFHRPLFDHLNNYELPHCVIFSSFLFLFCHTFFSNTVSILPLERERRSFVLGGKFLVMGRKTLRMGTSRNETPNVPSTKSHVLFPLLKSCQRIRPGLRAFETIRNNKKCLRWGVVGPTPNPQAGGPPIVGCPRLLIQYIRRYPQYPEDFPPSATWVRTMP